MLERGPRSEEVVYAIDYGTSNSLLAYSTREKVFEPLPMDEEALDPTVFRSLLYFPHQNECFYGQKAVTEYAQNYGEGRLIRSVKKYLPSTRFVGSYIEDRVVRLEDLIGYFLLEMRKRANEALDLDVTSVVLGRPAKFSFDPSEDKMAEYRLKKAAEIAGFTDIQFLPEPIAAAFDMKQKLKTSQNILVVDLGGGTSDFTVIRIGPDDFREEDLLALGGVPVAGDLIDGRFVGQEVSPFFGATVQYRYPGSSNVLKMPPILKDCLCSPADIVQMRRGDHYDFFQQIKKMALSEEDKRCLNSLMVLAEDQLGFELYESVDRCKRGLSEGTSSPFEFVYPEIDIQFVEGRERFNQVIAARVQQITDSMDETLKQSQLQDEQIDVVYCTGGTAKLFVIQEYLKKRFGQDKLVQSGFFHSVVSGLAHYAQDRLNQ